MRIDIGKKKYGPLLSIPNVVVRKNGKEVFRGPRKEVNVFLGLKPYSPIGYKHIADGYYKDYTFELLEPLFELYDDIDDEKEVWITGSKWDILEQTGMEESYFSYVLHGRSRYQGIYKIRRIQ